ncbi:unnamed protein product [Ectocarpus fasciculatus]
MTHNVKRFRIGLPSEEHVMGMKTASCIVVKGTGKDGSVAVRPYTPTTTNDTKGHFDLVIKVYPEGNVSSHMFSLKVGDTVTVSAAVVVLRQTYPIRRIRRVSVRFLSKKAR